MNLNHRLQLDLVPQAPARWGGLRMGHARRLFSGILAAFILVLGVDVKDAMSDVRVALVVGNAAYATAPLVNSLNDASKMAQTLRHLGFEVIEVQDASRARMASAIETARGALAGRNGVGLFYYAGHGMQLDWRNYLIPVDAKLANAEDVVQQTVDLEMVMAAFKAARTRLSILVLDACRDNPFAHTSSAKGLAPVDAPTGTFLAYATAPGNVAQDGSEQSGHGLYTQHLLEELAQPEARLEDVFKRVRTKVRQQSRGRQIPWETTSLEDDFYFNRPVAAVVDKPLEPGSLEELLRRQTAFEKEKTDWDRVRESKNADDLFAYLNKHPNGYMSEQAQFRLDQLQKPAVAAQALNHSGPTPLPSGRRRYEVGDRWVVERTDNVNFSRKSSTHTVTSVDDIKVVINDGEFLRDQMGSVLKDMSGTKDPGIMLVPADIAVGKRWRSAFTNKDPSGHVGQGFLDIRVTGMETIALPSGSFEAFKISLAGSSVSANGVTRLGGTAWIDPVSMHPVKMDFQRFFGGRRTYDISEVVVSIQRVARPQ